MSKLSTFLKAFNVRGVPWKIGNEKYPELANMYQHGAGLPGSGDAVIVWDAEGQPYQLLLDNDVWWRDESYRSSLRRNESPLPDRMKEILYNASIRKLDRMEKEYDPEEDIDDDYDPHAPAD